MAVQIVGLQFYDEYSGSGATKTSFIMGSFADKLGAIVTVEVSWSSLNIQGVWDVTAKTLKRTDNYSFIRDGFRVGDTCDWIGATVATNDASYTITAVTDSTLTFSGAPASSAVILGSLYGTTNIDAIDFYFNLIENSSALTFTSLTDNQTTQKLSAYSAGWGLSTQNLTQATHSKGWITGSLGTAQKTTISNLASGYKQAFVITQGFTITPLYLSGDIVDDENGKLQYPYYFLNTNSLKYVCKVDARYDTINPTIPHTTTNYDFPLGNVGWFSEFLNGGVPEYSLTSVSYIDTATSLPVDYLQIDRTTTVTAIINSANGAFVAQPKMAVNFFYCPEDSGDYIDTKSTTLLENFRVDHKLLNVDGTIVNGINYGTDYQAFQDISAVINTVNQATLTFKINLSQQTQSFLENKSENNRKLLIMVTPQKWATTYLGDTDRNAVLIGINQAVIDTDDSTLLTWQNTLFYQSPDTTINAYTDYKGWIGDHILTNTKFQTLGAGTPISLTFEVVAYNTVTDEQFSLQSYSQAFPESEINGALCSDVKPRVLNYKLSSDDPRNYILLSRNVSLDTTTNFGWELNYPFVARYETWRDAPNYASDFSCEHSQDWSIYSLMPDWGVKTKITAIINDADGNPTTFIRYGNLELKDDSITSDGLGGQLSYEMKTFYDNAGTLTDGKGIIFNDQDTCVKMIITGNFPNTDELHYSGYLALDIPDIGGEFTRDVNYVNKNPLTTSVWGTPAFLTVDSATQITIEGVIDYRMLSLPIEGYQLTGRLSYRP